MLGQDAELAFGSSLPCMRRSQKGGKKTRGILLGLQDMWTLTWIDYSDGNAE